MKKYFAKVSWQPSDIVRETTYMHWTKKLGILFTTQEARNFLDEHEDVLRDVMIETSRKFIRTTLELSEYYSTENNHG